LTASRADRQSPCSMRDSSTKSLTMRFQTDPAPIWAFESRASAIKYRPDIDGLRAVAVIGVVVYHAMPQWLPGGFVGVDVFFVISGYLITSIILPEIESGSFSFWNFYRRRIRRILPALVVVIAAVWIIGWFVLWPTQFAQLGLHILAASTFVSNYLLASESGYFDAAAQTKPLLHLWSLAIEEQFYLIWPGLLLVACRLRLSAAGLLCFILVTSFSFGESSLAREPAWAFYGLPGRSWELAIGALLAVLRKPVAVPMPIFNVMGVVGAALIVISMVVVDQTSPFPGWRALGPTVGTAALIAAGPSTPVGRLLSLRPVVAIGLISYPLYLWHWPLIAFAGIAGVQSTPRVAVTILCLSLLLSWLTYTAIETPIRSSGSIMLRRCASTSLIALLFGAGILGAVTQWSGGLAFRLDQTQKRIADFHFDYDRAYRGGTCLIGQAQDESAFTSDCVRDVGAPLLLLWGDSHAAHLYPGLKTLEGQATFSLAQFTASACAPVLDVGSSHCRRINDFAINQIARLKPHTVILAASWWAYPDNDLVNLDRSVDQLRRIGIDKVILVGPVPIWNPSLPLALLAFYSAHREIPKRMQFGLTRMTDMDNTLHKMSLDLGIAYFSVLSAMCDSEGCLTRVGNDVSDLTAWDSATIGSIFIANRLSWRSHQ